MKRRVVMAAFLLAAALFTQTAYAEQLAGGWAGTESITIPEEAQEAFSQVTSTLSDMSYESVGLLSTQVVAGTNYCLLCRTKVPDTDLAPGYCLMYIYVDLDGEASLLRIENLEFSADEPIEESETEAAIPSELTAAEQ